MLRVLVAACAVITLSACAGRAPQIAPLVNASDTQLSCAQINSETKLNGERITTLSTEQSWKVGQNAVAGIIGFMAWPAWLALDFQNAAGQEAHALSQRNQYLTALSRDRCASTPATQNAALESVPESASALASNAEIEASLLSR